MHLRFVSVDKKIRAISVAFIDSLFARILIPNYLIFSRFYLKNRTTTKPTSKSLFFNDFNARRGIAIPNYNSMVNDGNYPVRFHKREQTIGQHLHARQRLSYGAKLDLISNLLYYNIETWQNKILSATIVATLCLCQIAVSVEILRSKTLASKFSRLYYNIRTFVRQVFLLFLKYVFYY